ncbi:MAG: hypothetical protein ACO2Y5_08085 [Nitrosopumilaceae archaeon]
MGMAQDKSRQKLDKWALVVVIVIASAFGATIFAKNWQYGVIFYLILAFAVIAMKKGWFKDRIFHD